MSVQTKPTNYDPVRGAAALALSSYDTTEKSFDEALRKSRELVGVDDRDLRFFLRLVHGVTKMRRRLDYQLQFFLARPSDSLAVKLRNVLRLGLYQLQYTDRVPQAAAVSESVNLARYFYGTPKARMVNGILRSFLRNPDKCVFPDRAKNPLSYLANFYSYPDYFVQSCLDEFGLEQTERLLERMNQPQRLTIRVNRLKTNAEKLEAALTKNGVEFVRGEYLDDFYTLPEAGIKVLQDLLDDGSIYVQDQSAGMAVRLLNPRPGTHLLDLTSAPGGKTTYAASRMRGKGRITALDKSKPRLQVLVDNCQRLGVKIVSPVACDAVKFESDELFERVIIDPPCSGWGTAGRHPDLRWSKSLEDIQQMTKIQRKLLETGAKFLKPGGLLVYSTCTVMRQENDQIIEEFLLRHKEFELESASEFFDSALVSERGFVKTYPAVDLLDGGFAARLKRKPN